VKPSSLPLSVPPPPSLPPYLLRMLAAVTALLLLNQPRRGVREEVKANTLGFSGERLEEEVELEGDEGEDTVDHGVGVIFEETHV